MALIDKLTAIAEAIRDKTGSTETMTLAEMPLAIANIESGGGQEDNYYDTFWDNYQKNGERSDYSNAFSIGWNDAIFKPKYDIKPTQLAYTFSYSDIGNLKELLQNQGVVLDTTNTYNHNYAFAFSKITHIPAIDTRGATPPATLMCAFQTATKLETIDNLILKDDGSQTFSNTFSSCSSLKNLTITGCIGQNITFTNVPLSHDSLLSVLNALKSGVSGKVYLGSSNVAKLTDTEKAIATDKGWTLV